MANLLKREFWERLFLRRRSKTKIIKPPNIPITKSSITTMTFSQMDLNTAEIIPDSFNPLNLLPLEMWAAIFERVGSPYDLINCSRSSYIWENLLKVDYPALFFVEAFPPIVKYLGKNDLLNCRLVCQHWKELADSHFDNVISGHQRASLEFEDSDGIASFMDKMAPLEGFQLKNQIIGRRVYFSPFQEQDMEAYWNMAAYFLEIFGSYIWYFEWRVYAYPEMQDDNFPPPPRPLEVIKTLIKCIKLLPNLRQLSVDYFVTEYQNDAGEQDHKNILKLLEEKPLPDLPDLTVFDVGFLPTAIWNAAMMRYGNQLVELNLPRTCNLSVIKNQGCPNLQKLRVQANASNNYLQTLVTLAEDNRWALKELCIHVLSDKTDSIMKTVARLLKIFKKSLETLQLEIYKLAPASEPTYASIDHLKKIKLPQLKTLNVYMSNLESLDFLQDLCPYLERLNLRCTHTSKPGKLGIGGTQEQNNFHDLYHTSHIWDKLQFLQTIQVLTLEPGPGYGVFTWLYGRNVWEYLLTAEKLEEKSSI